MSEVKQLEAQMEANQKTIARRDMALKLASNREFRKLILEDYMINEAAAFAAASGDINMSAEQRADSVAMAQAPGHLKRWLHVITTQGNTAEDQNSQIEAILPDMRAQEDAEDQDVTDVEAHN